MSQQTDPHIRQARKIAADHGMYVTDKGDHYRLFRKAERPIYLGMRANPSAMLTLVKRCATSKS